MLRKYIANTYLTYNLIIGTIYILWIYMLYYNKCKCSKHLLEKIIHIYWYIILILDIMIFFRMFSIDELHLIVIGNLLGLGNIYLTYRYIKYLEKVECKCSDMLLKDFIIITYVCVAACIIGFFIALGVSYLHYGKIHLFERLRKKTI